MYGRMTLPRAADFSIAKILFTVDLLWRRQSFRASKAMSRPICGATQKEEPISSYLQAIGMIQAIGGYLPVSVNREFRVGRSANTDAYGE
jgi:hypothetical protein